MLLEEATEAITARFTTLWGTTTPLQRENEAFKPPANGASWVRITIRHDEQQQRTVGPVGARKFDRHGLIFVSIFVDSSAGRGPADRLVSAVRAIFEAKSFSEIVTHHTAAREVGVDGRWFQVNAVTSFRYEETK